MEKKELNKLLYLYLKGECNPSERRLVEIWLDKRFASSTWLWKDEKDKLDIKDRIRLEIQKSIASTKTTPININRLLIWAASITIFIAAAIFFAARTSERSIANKTVMMAVKPGTKSAVLTLEDGSVIKLDEATNGVLTEKRHVTIKKIKEGQLVYQTAGLEKTEKAFMNTISIPLGGQYQVTLPDGTDVWMNSGSSLSYPSYFSGKSREVHLTGEAYFEVAKNTKMPFSVRAGDIDINVIGTHFNVSAYQTDNRIVTTLLEGRIEVQKNAKKIQLYPDQQAVSIPKSDYFIRQIVNAELAIAWKNGYFAFEDQDINEVMKDVSRWYNVEVSVIGDVKNSKKIVGTFSRSKSLEDLLLYLQKLEVAKFKKEGRKIIVII